VLRTSCCLHSLKGACFASNKPMTHLQTPPLAKPLPGSADEVLCFDPPTWHNPPCTSLCQKHLSVYRSELEQDGALYRQAGSCPFSIHRHRLFEYQAHAAASRQSSLVTTRHMRSQQGRSAQASALAGPTPSVLAGRARGHQPHHATRQSALLFGSSLVSSLAASGALERMALGAVAVPGQVGPGLTV
jgi:hypothetical protein